MCVGIRPGALRPEAPMNDGNNYNCPKVLELSLVMIQEGLGQL